MYAPIPSNYAAPGSEGTVPKPTESNFSAGVQNWLSRMRTEEARAIYKHRPASVECTNADARKRGYYQVWVRSLKKSGQYYCGSPWRIICYAPIPSENKKHLPWRKSAGDR